MKSRFRTYLCGLSGSALLFACGGLNSAPVPFVPNDPYYFPNTNSLNYSQWYLNTNGTTAKVDINVVGAWARGLTGEGMVIGIVDGPVQIDHPDLAPNLDPDESWDFVNDRTGAFLPPASERHGTPVAGLAAARGGNGIGITGVAPDAKFAVLPVLVDSSYLFSDTTAIQRITDAVRYHSVGPEKRIHIKNFSIGTSSPFASMGMVYSGLLTNEFAVQASADEGCIIVAGAGNFRHRFGVSQGEADANKLHITHLTEVIVTTVVGYDESVASYANFGSSVTCAAPSRENGPLGDFEGTGVLSTDQFGASGYNTSIAQFPFEPADLDYTRFTGTSATAPIVSGVLALAKQAQPNLDVRMAKHLLAHTCRVVNPGDALPTGGWTTNAAGFHFNNNYGFGLIDADALTLQAAQFSGVTPLVTNTTGEILADAGVIVMNDTNGVTRTCVVTNTAPLEEVQLRLKVNRREWTFFFPVCYGQLGIVLVSPSGTRSVLSMPNPITREVRWSTELDWTYCANTFWGENPQGEWTIIVSHPYPPQAGTLEMDFFPNGYKWYSFELITRSGQLIEAPSALVRLSDPQVSANGMTFTLAGPTGRSAIIESSGNLIDWTPFTTNLLVAAPSTIVDVTSTSESHRFYRARLEPEPMLAAAASRAIRPMGPFPKPAPAPAPSYPPRRPDQPLDMRPPGGGVD